MAAVALIKFTQGPNTDVGGKAVLGTLVDGVVTITNDDNTDVASWDIDLLYNPPGSALGAVPQTPVSLGAAVNGTPTASFTPDADGGFYRVCLRVRDSIGIETMDVRCFGVPDASSKLAPPYQKFPDPLPLTGSNLVGERPDELNFGSNVYGWVGDGTDGLVNDVLTREVIAVVEVVTDLAALAAIDISGSVAGTLAEVASLLDQFIIIDDATTLAAADAITIVAPTVAVGNKVWVRRNLGNEKWRTHTAWYIDADNGDDEAAGDVVGSPLKSFHEIDRRYGPSPTIGVNVSIWVIKSTSVVDVNVTGWAASGDIFVIGVQSIASSGTLDSVVSWDIATKTAQQIEGPGFSSLPTDRYVRVDVTGSGQWVNLWKMGVVAGDEIITSAPEGVALPSIGDPFEVIELPAVNIINLDISGPIVVLSNVFITGTENAAWPRYLHLFESRADQLNLETRFAGYAKYAIDCVFDNCSVANSDVSFKRCVLAGTLFTNCTVTLESRCVISQYITAPSSSKSQTNSNGNTFVFSGEVLLYEPDTVGLWVNPKDVVYVYTGAYLMGPAAGQANPDYGIYCRGRVEYEATATIDITATLAEVKLGSLDRTLAALMATPEVELTTLASFIEGAAYA